MNNELFEYEINNDNVTILKYVGKLAEVEIPAEIDGNPVTIIGNDAFRNCDFLTYVRIPESVIKIGKYAFAGCSSLISILIPDSVTVIGDHAFSPTLKSVSIPSHPIDLGRNFSNISVLVHCKCGQKFLLDPNSHVNPVCPRCGFANQYTMPASCSSFFLKILLLIGTIFGSIGLLYLGCSGQTFARACGFVIFSAFAALVIDGFNQIRYMSFKSSINPDLAMRRRPSSNVKLTETPQEKSASEISESSSSSIENTALIENTAANEPTAANDNTANNADEGENALQDFLTNLDENKAHSQMQPLPDYHHQNSSMGCIQIPLIIIAIGSFILMFPLISSGNIILTLVAIGMNAVLIPIAILTIRQELYPLQIMANEKGIQCNKTNPNFIPWDSVSKMSFQITPITFFSSVVKTSMIITLQLKGRPKSNIGLRFNDEFEANLCQKSFEEFFRRSKMKS